MVEQGAIRVIAVTMLAGVEPDYLAGDLLATDVGKVADPARIGGMPGPEQSDVFRLQQK